MKVYAIFILISLVLFGCSKSNDPAKPDAPVFPKAVTHYLANFHLISYRNFSFDSGQHLVSIYLRQNDTLDVSSGIFEVDSGTFRFDLDPVTNLPKGYRFDYKKGYQGAVSYTETHLMYYNSQNQLIKDSGLLLLPGQNPNPPTMYYIYNGTTMVCRTYLSGNPFMLDTIMINNGNIEYYSSNYNDGNGGWTNQFRSSIITYSSAENPLYNPDLSKSLGAFLFVNGVDDFLSKNLPNSDGFSWVTGNNGKVASGSSPNGDYTNFTY